MIIHARNYTAYGFFILKNKYGKPIRTSIGVSCSQVIRTQEKLIERVHSIDVFYPDDWLTNNFRNPHVLSLWAGEVSNWFAPVTYEGNIKTKDIDKDSEWSLKSIRLNLGYDEKYEESHPEFMIRGDYIYNDKWHKFTIKPEEANMFSERLMAYASFVLIRYLFCADLQEIPINYFGLRKLKKNYGYNVDDYSLIQLAHYGSDSMAEYNATYTLICPTNRRNTSSTSLCKKLSTLIQVHERMHSTNKLFEATCPETSTHLCEEISKHLNSNQLDYAYNKLK